MTVSQGVPLVLLLLLVGTVRGVLQWNSKKPMVFARSDFVAVSVDSKIYVLGGCNGNQSVDGTCPSITNYFTSYDPSSDSWTVLPVAPRPRYRYMAAALNNSIYYIGGRHINDSLITAVDVYSISTNSWSTLQGNGLARSDGGAFVIDGKLFVTGGYDNNYTPLSDTLTLSIDGSFQGGIGARMTGSGDIGAVSIGGYGYVFGGWGPPSNACLPLKTMEKYDPKNNQWTTLPSLLHGRGDMAFTVVGKWIFVMGGETANSNCKSVPLLEVEAFDTVNQKWVEVSSLAITRFRFSGGAVGNLIFDIGGQGAEDGDHYPVLNNVYSLDVSDVVNPAPTPTPTPSSAAILRGAVLLVLLLTAMLLL